MAAGSHDRVSHDKVSHDRASSRSFQPVRLLAGGLLGVLLASLAGSAVAGGQHASVTSGGPAAGRVLWLRADRGVERGLSGLVSTWHDQSAAGHDVSQTLASWQPHYEPLAVNGRAALHFDGDDLLVRSDGMPTGSYTKIAIVVLEDYQSNNNILSGDYQHALFYGFSDRAQLFHSGTFVTSDTPTLPGEVTVLIGTYDATTGQGALYQNGAPVGVGSAGPNTDPGVQVGAFAQGHFLHGWIAELAIYDRVLSDHEITIVEDDLEQRYLAGPSRPEVVFTERPRDGQIVPRELAGARADQAILRVGGWVVTPGWEGVRVDVRRDGAAWARVSRPLGEGSGPWPFSLAITLDAGLFDHEITVSLVRPGDTRPVERWSNVTCGDLLLLNGQSNTVASDYHGEGLANQSQSHWIRSFSSTVYNPSLTGDLHWDMAEGEDDYSHAAVGAWGLRMAEILVNQYAVPIGLLNGSVGGTAIGQHLRDDADPTNLYTIYGRLLYRAIMAGADRTARAMLWYQGESDGEQRQSYERDFARLHASWTIDYPALENIFVFQIRKGCGVDFAGVREVLRRLPETYPEIRVMSTSAAPRHDGCHYYYAGYRELGDRIARVVARDLYGSTDTQEIDPPDVVSASWLNAMQDAIVLTFADPDDTLIWESGSEAYFLLDDGTPVVSGTVAGNTITLWLGQRSTASTVGYDGHPYDGPWITNARGVGALTFFELPIQ